MYNKSVIITGVTGQLGQFLAKYFLDNLPNIKVIGTVRHKSYDNQPYIFDKSKITFELMDLTDVHSIENLIIKYKPDYFINTAANAFVGESWAVPLQHISQNSTGVLHQLESIRKHSKYTRYFNMGSSEEFGCSENNGLQNENTKIEPKSPYGCSKAMARYLINVYRKSYNLYAVQNFTYNFESELRGIKYVTKKITSGVAQIKYNIDNNKSFSPIELGNVNSFRSWQFAGDVADSIWKSLNQEKFNNKFYQTNDGVAGPKNGENELDWFYKYASKNIKEYVISSPECHSVKEFVAIAFSKAGINGEWIGEGLNEKFIWKNFILVTINSNFFRPIDVTFLNGDASAIRKDLDWLPTLTFEQLVDRMIKYDLKQIKS